MDLFLAAKKHAETPSDINAMTGFMDALAQEKSVEEIKRILPLDFERITGLALRRLTELLPSDIELMLRLALWNYHFGLDDDAHKNIECAKSVAAFDLRVLQAEIFLSYGNPPDYILSLVQSALSVFPNDKWLLAIKQKIEQTGQLNELSTPPLLDQISSDFGS
jgi:hypothetical protein